MDYCFLLPADKLSVTRRLKCLFTSINSDRNFFGIYIKSYIVGCNDLNKNFNPLSQIGLRTCVPAPFLQNPGAQFLGFAGHMVCLIHMMYQILRGWQEEK